jgi:polyisoprenoid-binding protein YceI
MKNVFLALAVVLSVFSTQAQTTWKVDASHTSLGFSVAHMVIAETEGRFKVYEGTIVTKNEDFTDAQINFSVDVASINTEDAKRDEHLRNSDFFDAPKYPKMTFKSTSFKKVSGKNYVLEGDLTIKGVTKRVKFDVVYNGQVKSPWGTQKAGFTAKTVINRTDYGLKYNSVLEAGGLAIGEEVNISLKLEFDKQ